MPPSCIIVGAGFGGICMAIKLKEAGMNDFVILERHADLGGTWFINTYPGAACDVESLLYSYSFEPKSDWTKEFGSQSEILDYLRHCARKYGLYDHFQFNTTVTDATYSDNSHCWTVTTSTGATHVAAVLISCSGGLSQHQWPDIKGISTFAGTKVHTAQWDPRLDVTGKRVGVIGSGASAIQVVPAIAPIVQGLTVFQRTPSWIIPKFDCVCSSFRKALFSLSPQLQYLCRLGFYWYHEFLGTFFFDHLWMMRLVQEIIKLHVKSVVKDKVLLDKVIPKYLMGCKRLLLSNDWYPALQRSNVQLITDGIQEINQTGIRCSNGQQHDLDVIVFATGFNAAPNGVSCYRITGRDGRDLDSLWREGQEAYLGTSVAGFPNMFLVVGPNVTLAHSSMLLMIESQVHYIMLALNAMRKESACAIDVKPDVQSQFNCDIQKKLSRTVWQSGGCSSWYQTKGGKNTALWPGYTFSFIIRTRKFYFSNYEFIF